MKPNVAEQGIPFKPTKNPATIHVRWDAQVAEALKGLKYKTAEDSLRGL